MKKFTILATLFAAFTLSMNAQDEGFITPAFNDDLESTFDWSKASKFVPIIVSESVSEVLSADLRYDMRPNDANIHLWVWSETYVGNSDNDGFNSFGEEENHFAMTVSDKGWSGLGVIRDGASNFSFIDDTYVLHIGIKGNPRHSHAFGLGSINFAVGSTPILDNGVPVKNIGSWPDDGEWYFIDLPIKELKKMGANLFSPNDGGPSAFTNNFFWILSGGTEGNELHIDNVFLYKDSTLEPEFEIGDVNGDGNVNVSDVTTLINMLLGTVTLDNQRADINGDENVNVSDVTALINMLLGNS